MEVSGKIVGPGMEGRHDILSSREVGSSVRLFVVIG